MNTQLDTSIFFPCVLQAVATDDFQVYAYFNDGSVRLFDVKPLIQPGTVFEPLRDIEVFRSSSGAYDILRPRPDKNKEESP